MIKYIDRKETIEQYKKEHETLKDLVSSLTEKEAATRKVLGDWTIKDVIAHLAAWNWEAIDEVDRVLKNKPTWPELYEHKEGENKFNQKQVDKRKGMSWAEVIKDWDDSFWEQIKVMEKLTESQWKHQAEDQFWSDGTPVTVYSLFAYEYEGEGHEGGHAKQLAQFIKNFAS